MSLFSFFKKNEDNTVKTEKKEFVWIPLNEVEQLQEIENASVAKPQVIFKHSTRCSISDMALTRFERDGNDLEELADCYYNDLIIFRDVSNAISEQTGVTHQSPQVIVLKNKEVVYTASHSAISASAIINLLK